MLGSKHSYIKFMKFGVPIPTRVESSNLSIAGDGSRRCEVSFLTLREKNLLHLLEPSLALRQYDYTNIIIFSLSIFYLHHEVKLARVEQVE
jgi:hypothetical protein